MLQTLEVIDRERERLTRQRAEMETQVREIDQRIEQTKGASASSILDGDARTATKQRSGLPALRDEREVLLTAIEAADARLITLADERLRVALENARARYGEAERLACESAEALHQVMMRCVAEIASAAQAAFEAKDAADTAGGDLRRAGEEPPFPPAYEQTQGWGRYPGLYRLACLVRDYGDAPTEFTLN
jgi:hypothetical protein